MNNKSCYYNNTSDSYKPLISRNTKNNKGKNGIAHTSYV